MVLYLFLHNITDLINIQYITIFVLEIICCLGVLQSTVYQLEKATQAHHQFGNDVMSLYKFPDCHVTAPGHSLDVTWRRHKLKSSIKQNKELSRTFQAFVTPVSPWVLIGRSG